MTRGSGLASKHGRVQTTLLLSYQSPAACDQTSKGRPLFLGRSGRLRGFSKMPERRQDANFTQAEVVTHTFRLYGNGHRFGCWFSKGCARPGWPGVLWAFRELSALFGTACNHGCESGRGGKQGERRAGELGVHEDDPVRRERKEDGDIWCCRLTGSQILWALLGYIWGVHGPHVAHGIRAEEQEWLIRRLKTIDFIYDSKRFDGEDNQVGRTVDGDGRLSTCIWMASTS